MSQSTFSDQQQAFLDVLAANEDDNDTRLIYADWLEEHGQPSEADRQRHWAASKAWLVAFCKSSDCPDYSLIIRAAMNPGEFVRTTEHVSGVDEDDGEPYEYDDTYGCQIQDGSFYSGGRDAYGEIPPEFWDHLEVVTGVKQRKRPEYFRCGC